MTGKELWHEKRGTKNVSLEKCDLGMGPGVIKDAYVHMPRYFKDTDRVMDLESRLLYCMVNLQGLDAGKIKKNAISGKGEYSSDMESLVGYVVSASHGRSEEHTSELQSLMRISYAVFCLKKKKKSSKITSSHSQNIKTKK